MAMCVEKEKRVIPFKDIQINEYFFFRGILFFKVDEEFANPDDDLSVATGEGYRKFNPETEVLSVGQ